jgi:hypothetical protein
MVGAAATVAQDMALGGDSNCGSDGRRPVQGTIASIPAALVVSGDFMMGNFIESLMIMGGAIEVVAGLITGLGLLVLMQWAGR